MKSEVWVMIVDGASEYGALVELHKGIPALIVMAPPDSPLGVPPPDLARNIQTINVLLRKGIPWNAIETMAADSPRIGPIVEQIAARLNGEKS